jgi:collagenase-like PrtC family protease
MSPPCALSGVFSASETNCQTMQPPPPQPYALLPQRLCRKAWGALQPFDRQQRVLSKKPHRVSCLLQTWRRFMWVISLFRAFGYAWDEEINQIGHWGFRVGSRSRLAEDKGNRGVWRAKNADLPELSDAFLTQPCSRSNVLSFVERGPVFVVRDLVPQA